MNTQERIASSEESAAAAPPGVSLTPLTGRATEVSLLRDRWEQAQEGMGQVVLVVGEAGLGKSRLVQTIRNLALEQVGEVVEWSCAPRFQNTGLFPVSDHLGRLLGLGGELSAHERFDRLAQHLDDCGLGRAEVVALFAKLLFLPADERYPAPGLTPVREREETFRALHQWLRARAERQPLLFVIEDLHWVDASTLEFLGQFIAEGLHDRILTVLTFRPEFQTPWPAVAHQTTIALNRLTRRQAAEFLGSHRGAALPESLVAQVYQRTRGVPLLLEEFSRIIRESVAEEERARDFPTTLPELIMARLDRMSSRREVAQLAATLGREFHYGMLAAVVSVEEAILSRELEKLVLAEILCVKGEPPQSTYTFKHALLEEALHGALEAEQRRQFHRQVAEAMEARFPEAAARQPELLAQHFTEAGLLERAIACWLKAALRARESFANVEAVVHLTKGLELLNTLPPSRERDGRELELLGPLGTAYIASRGYAAPEVGPVFDRARELCDRVAQTPQHFAMMWGNYAFRVVRGDFPFCAQLAEEAIEFGERLNDPGILMEALFLRGLAMLYRGDFAGARVNLARSMEYDDRARTAFWAGLIGEDAGVTVRCYLALALWHAGLPEQALALDREALALAREIQHPFSLEYALHHRAWLHQHCQLGASTQAAGEEQMRIATEQGFSFWHASGIVYQAAGMLLQPGRVEEGLGLMLRGLEAYRATGAVLGLTYYLGLLAEGFITVGRHAEAHRALDEALLLVEKNEERFEEAELLRLRGELLLAEAGDEAAAEEQFQRALATARRQQSRAWELRATTSLARLWHRQDRKPQAFAVLSAACGLFTEGFALPDLVEAAALLKELSNERMRADFAAGLKYVHDCIPPPMEGKVAIDWRYVPSSTLGGDTLGFHWIDAEHLALYLIDVTGHGLDSALLSVSISNVLRSASLPGTDMRCPEEVLARLNESFQGGRHGNKFFTIWYGVYHAPERVLHWSGGGHHASVLLAPGREEPLLLHSTGPMMGVLLGARFPVKSCSVPPGSRLVIFSDGVFEIRREGQAVWDLNACIGHLQTLSQRAGTLMDDLLRYAQELRGSPQLDDDFSVIEARFE